MKTDVTYLHRRGYTIEVYDQWVYPICVKGHGQLGRFWTIESAVRCLKNWNKIW